ncbi:hypothetical protein NEICINOT_04459 [Neisseria cinerea ATCC 14685]|uniref:Uncharacterized protein n=1 Tax=Neisseria cinerea ATCC 14685 TaxID=546262 RepID=D0W464_NEICI|nr:hypothetical protein NEICINOT_04459 [Neisseria cinerea ATCC 14685]
MRARCPVYFMYPFPNKGSRWNTKVYLSYAFTASEPQTGLVYRYPENTNAV